MEQLLAQANIVIIALAFAVSLAVLTKAADSMVDNAVALSQMCGLPEMIIGATVVSMGTTLPELSASVVSALQGSSGFALGNAIGSVITNNSLILGLGALFGSIPVGQDAARKFSLLVAAVMGLLLMTLFAKFGNAVGVLPSWLGSVFLLALPVYLSILLRQEKNSGLLRHEVKTGPTAAAGRKRQSNAKIIAKIIIAALIIALSAAVLVASVEAAAERIGISDVIIASTLVAFGTSVPEVSTMLAAVKKRRGGLAVGNVLGANILNILLVLGASLAVSKEGFRIPADFFTVHIPALVIVIAVFGYFVYNRKIYEISKIEGIVLILIYLLYLAGNLMFVFAGA